MKTHFITPILAAFCFMLTSAGTAQATTSTEGLDTLKTNPAKAAAPEAPKRTFQHHLSSTKKRNNFRLAVAAPDAPETDLRVYDQQGNLVHRYDAKGDTVVCDLDVSLLQPGNYTLRIVAGERIAEEKFTVQ